MKDEIKKTDIRVPSQALSSPPRFREWLLHQEVQGSGSFVGGQAELDELIRKLSPKPTLAEVLTLLQEGVSRERGKGAKDEGAARGDARPTDNQTPKAGEGRQGMEVAGELGELLAPLWQHAGVLLPDGTRVVLAHVQSYRLVGRTLELRVNAVASSPVIQANLANAGEGAAALAFLDEHFRVKALGR